MLESEPTDTATTTDSGDTAADIPAGAPADGAAPRARAPRKRAPRKAAAPAAEPAAEQPAAERPAAEQSAAERPAAEPAPRKRAPRKAAAKKAAPAEAVAEVETAEPASGEPVSGEPVSGDGAPPAKKAPRKRAAKKAPARAAEPPAPADAADSTADPDSIIDDPAELTADPSGEPAPPAAPGVLFLAPDVPSEPAPAARRRRAAKKAAPAAAAPETDAETAPAPEGIDITAAEDAEDLTAEPEDIREAAAEQASTGARRRRRRGRRGRGGARNAEGDTEAEDAAGAEDDENAGEADVTAAEAGADTDDGDTEGGDSEGGTGNRRRRRRRRSSGTADEEGSSDDPPNTVTHVREKKAAAEDDGVRGVKGSTRLEAKRQRRRDGRETTRRRAPILTEAEFLARREAVDRVMAVRQDGDRTQIAVLEDDILVEHYVTRASATSYVGNVYLGRVQNVLPSMEAAFIDIGKGRNGVLYAGEVNWDAAGLEGKSRAIEQALKSGDTVLVQVTKDPIGHKGARLTSQISLPGRFLVYVPGGGMTGISRRLPDTERHRLKSILKKIVPDDAGVIVRTAAEGASEEDLTHDVERLQAQWETIQKAAQKTKSAPTLVHGEPDLAIRVVRDVFNEDFKSLVVQGSQPWRTISDYIGGVAPDLAQRITQHTKDTDLFHDLRVDEQLMKALDRKVWLPSGGSLVIDRTEAMTVIDVNTGKFVGAGGNLEQTVTRNNLEAAEEIVRQLRLRDVGGIVVIDFIDMVLESNRELVLRRLTECLGRDRTKHQVAEVTSLGLVQMTRKRVGEGLLEAFSEPCEHCHGRGVIIHSEPVDQSRGNGQQQSDGEEPGRKRGRRAGRDKQRAGGDAELLPSASDEQRRAASAAIAAIHRAAGGEGGEDEDGSTAIDELASGLMAAALNVDGGRSRRAASGKTAAAAVETAEPADPTSSAVQAAASVEAPGDTVGAAAHPPAEPEEPAQEAAAPAPRRRRRAASRPAGPPVTTG